MNKIELIVIMSVTLMLMLGSFVYAVDFIGANFADDTVTVYENSKRYDIGVGDGPNKIDVKNGLIFVSNTKDNSITVINLNNKEIVKTIKVGKGPIGIEIGERFAYAVNSGSNSVSVIDLNSLVVTSTIKVENTPIDAVLRDDGTLLYVTNLGSNSISVINTQDNSVIDTIKDTRLIQSPSAIQITPNNDFLYILNTKNDLLVRIDANKYNVRTNYVELSNVNINNDLIVGNKYALISSNDNGKGKVIIINLVENEVINSFDFEKEIFGIDFEEDEFIISTDNDEILSFVLGEKSSKKFKVGSEPRGVKIISGENSSLKNNATFKSKLFWTALIILVVGFIFWRRKKRDLEEDYIVIPESGHKKIIPEKKEVKEVNSGVKEVKKVHKQEVKREDKKEAEVKKYVSKDAKKEIKVDVRKKDNSLIKNENKNDENKMKEKPKFEAKKEENKKKEEAEKETKKMPKQEEKKELKNEKKTDTQKVADKKGIEDDERDYDERKQVKKEEPEINYKDDYNIDEDFY